MEVFQKGPPTSWSWSSWLHVDKKVTAHSKNPYLQHCQYLSTTSNVNLSSTQSLNIKILFKCDISIRLQTSITAVGDRGFTNTPSPASEMEHFEIFSCLKDNQLAWQFFVKFNFLCSFSFPDVASVSCIYGGI